MAYALIPEGYSLKKVTKLQAQAVNAKRRHDNVEAFLANPNTPLLIGGVGLLTTLPILYNLFLQSLEDQNVILTDQQKGLLKTGFDAYLLTIPVIGPQLLGEKLAEVLFSLKKEDKA
jgi:predicted aspartyl protease